MKTNPGRFFEDYQVGEVIAHAVPRTVSPPVTRSIPRTPSPALAA